MKLLTWNVGRFHLSPLLGRLADKDSRARDEDMPLIARAIERTGADMIALQELASPAQFEILLRALGGDFTGAVAEPEHFDRRVAVIARADWSPSFAIVTTCSGRSAVAAISAGAALLAVHVDAFSAPVRCSQLDELCAWLLARPEPIALLAGDLNLDFDHPNLALPHDREAMRRLAVEFDDLGARTGPTWLLGRRLDYVLARRPAPVAGVARRDDLRLPLGDHVPLLCTISRD